MASGAGQGEDVSQEDATAAAGTSAGTSRSLAGWTKAISSNQRDHPLQQAALSNVQHLMATKFYIKTHTAAADVNRLIQQDRDPDQTFITFTVCPYRKRTSLPFDAPDTIAKLVWQCGVRRATVTSELGPQSACNHVMVVGEARGLNILKLRRLIVGAFSQHRLSEKGVLGLRHLPLAETPEAVQLQWYWHGWKNSTERWFRFSAFGFDMCELRQLVSRARASAAATACVGARTPKDTPAYQHPDALRLRNQSVNHLVDVVMERLGVSRFDDVETMSNVLDVVVGVVASTKQSRT